MADISGIQAKVYEQTAKRRGNHIVREAGFTVCDSVTGKDLGFTVYPTREATEAAIPVLLKMLSDRLDKAAEREAATTKALTTVETGWSNASRARTSNGIGSRSSGLFLPTPSDQHGGCYYCGVKGCTECGTD